MSSENHQKEPAVSNVKRIRIIGHVPFNLNQHPTMQAKLASMNTPCSGLKIAYGPQIEMRPNAHGGKTAMYFFDVQGQEAVSTAWIESLIRDVYAIGGIIVRADATDIENNEKITIMKVGYTQLAIVPNFGEE
jgi:hypothetical protein